MSCPVFGVPGVRMLVAPDVSPLKLNGGSTTQPPVPGIASLLFGSVPSSLSKPSSASFVKKAPSSPPMPENGFGNSTAGVADAKNNGGATTGTRQFFAAEHAGKIHVAALFALGIDVGVIARTALFDGELKYILQFFKQEFYLSI